MSKTNLTNYRSKQLQKYCAPDTYLVDDDSHFDKIYKNSKKLFSKKSKYQNVEVYYNDFYGNIMVIDGDLQITEYDEKNYHEMLVHVPLNYNHLSKRVLVIGGGDGGTVREICKHKNVKEVIMVELDKLVVTAARKFFPKVSNKLDDKRVKLLFTDGNQWVKDNLKKYTGYFDQILVDSTDYNTAIELFSDKFYSNLSKMLSKGGIMCFNCINLSAPGDNALEIVDNLRKLYNHVYLYQTIQSSYGSGHYSFCFCSNDVDPRNTPVDWQAFYKKKTNCAYYNPRIHRDSFNLPNKYFPIVPKQRLGITLVIDLCGCDFKDLDNYNLIDKMCRSILKLYNLSLIKANGHKFKPQGVSFTYLLQESHLSIHTWPEDGKACMDLFTCGKYNYNIVDRNGNLRKTVQDVINEHINPKHIRITSMDREA